MNKYASHAITFALGLLVAAGICAYFKFRPSLPSVIAQPSKELANVKTETLKCVPLVVYRDASKKALGLPADVVKNQNQKMVGSTQVKASEYPHTVSALANIESGQVDMYVRRDRLPLLAFNRRYEIGVDYVLKNGAFVWEPDVRAELMQIKAVRLGVFGRLDSNGDFVPGARVWASW